MAIKEEKHFWIKGARRCSLAARSQVRRGDQLWDLPATDSFLHQVDEWTVKHHCGRRVDYDTFIFKNKKHLTFFLLHWS